MVKERINKIIASTGTSSRRGADELIAGGVVTINGKTIRDFSVKADLSQDIVTVDGKRIHSKKVVTLALNKPRGYITTRSDPHNRKTVYTLLSKNYEGLHPVGRLDKETSGLLLFTNDGSLTYQITHPKFEIRKKYQVTVRGKIKAEDIQKLETDFTVTPSGVENLQFNQKENKTRLMFDIGEGKKREIRNIFEALGYELLRLHRIQIGNLSLRGIAMGRMRLLKEKDIEAIFKNE